MRLVCSSVAKTFLSCIHEAQIVSLSQYCVARRTIAVLVFALFCIGKAQKGARCVAL